MQKLIVQGGTKLSGSIKISGSKNAALPILAATLLTEETVILKNVPNVSDTRYMLTILQEIGATVVKNEDEIHITAKQIQSKAPYEIVSKMRASICLMGPLLARTGRAEVSLPGGCVIGDRPVDLHLKGLQGIGAVVDMSGGEMIITAPEGLEGKEIVLRGKHGPTVLGTANLMMAATLTKGTTIIESAACEPEITDLAHFLIKLGAKIEGIGTRCMTIHGVEKLTGGSHNIIPDRIEAGTFMVAAALAGKKEGLTLHGVCEEHLKASSELLEKTGHSVNFTENGTTVTVKRGERPVGGNIITAPYPDFPTDMQAQFAALFALTTGISVIEDTIFPQRFMYCAELNRMGANIQVSGDGKAVIQGVEKLSGAPVMASDLRASAALILAALCAEGTTEINRLYHLDRGYENIDAKLTQLGAKVQRVTSENEE